MVQDGDFARSRGWCPDGPPPWTPPLPDPDPFGALPALNAFVASLASRPALLFSESAALGRAQARLFGDVLSAALQGGGAEGVAAVLRAALADDPRFAAPEWTRSPAHGLLAASWLAARRTASALLDAAPGLDAHARRKAAFFTEQALDALAPSNQFWLNPQALFAAWETRGRSVLDGVRNWMGDRARGDGLPNNTDREAFRVGRDLATTPGKVVARTRLAEILQYTPTTPQVRAAPVVLVPPWINKFYIMDLRRESSLVGHLVDAGFTVFLISWKNPDASYRDVGFAEYILEGVVAAKEVAAAVTGEPSPAAIGFCIGGMLLAMAQAWLAARGEPTFRALTLLAAMVDFEEPGPIKVFIDERSIRHIEDLMDRRGYHTSQEMASSFAFLRSVDLVWSYFVEGYLLGRKPPAFDMLAWNADGTRMPARFHSDYLRGMYLDNVLRVPNAVEVAGVPLDLGRIREDLYVVASERDHIAPAEMVYRVGRYVEGGVRFVRASGGHIAGIINPPARDKGWFEVAPDGGATAEPSLDGWTARAERRKGSWWPDFSAWLHERTGPLVAPPPLGSAAHPPLGDAPGTYVHEP